jgi:glycine cleavage system H protein
MAIAPLHHPADLHYLMEHQVWARLHGDGTATVGVTELGIRLSGEIYMCRAKRLGTEIAQGGTLAVVELAKAIVAVKSPVAGTVVALNGALDERPELVHRDPYGEGWIARLRLADFGADQPALLHGDAVARHGRRHAWDHRTELVPAISGGAPS